MARTVLIEASPRRASDGAAIDVRLAGGGVRPYTHRGFVDWRSGVTSDTRFATDLGFDQSGWTGGSIPQTGTIAFYPADKAYLSELASHLWIGAPITIRGGDDELLTPAWILELSGTVAAMNVREGALSIVVADLGRKLDDRALKARFAGTGGLEGIAEAEGRYKRRSFGRVHNVEGRVLNKAANIYEFGDPAFPLQAFDAVRDKGREGPISAIAEPTAQQTYDALVASTPPAGGAVVAPSIACVKWWTQPSGPLTADLLGEIATGATPNDYSENPIRLAKKLLATVPGGPAITGGVAEAARAIVCGLHIDDDETIAEALSRLLLGVSLTWVLEPAGGILVREISFASPVETVPIVGTVERVTSYRPVKSRKVGYMRNHRIHASGEISAAVLKNRGDWTALRSYGVGDIVRDQDAAWSALVDHVSAAGNRPPASPATENAAWIQISRGFNPVDKAKLDGVETGATNSANTGSAFGGGTVGGTITAINSNTTAIAQARADFQAADSTLTTEVNNIWAAFGRDDSLGFRSRVVNVENVSTGHASRISGVESTLNTPTTGIVARVGTAETAIVNNNNAISSRVTAVESEISSARGDQLSLSARFGSFVGSVVDRLAEKATVTSVTSLQSEVTNARGGFLDLNARFGTLTTTVADALAGKATVNSVTTLESTVNGHTSSITSLQTTTADIDGRLEATVGLSLNAGGRIAGFYIHASNQNRTTFDIMANVFRISDGTSDYVPFEVSGGRVLINGTLQVFSATTGDRVSVTSNLIQGLRASDGAWVWRLGNVP